MPKKCVKRLKAILTEKDYAMALQSFDAQKPITFRANVLRATEKDVLDQVRQSGLETTPVPWCPMTHLLTKGTVRNLQSLSAWEDGGLYIQSASSSLAVHAMQVEQGMRVLDMCAAPGSKTTLIAALMQNTGMLIANDRSRKRLYRLREILQNQGVTNTEVLCGPGERLGQTHADCFDRVLVDAPCSGEGRFRLDKPLRFERWSVQEIRSLSKLQEQLLVAAMRCVTVGGLVVYSTCTFAPEENELVLDKVLNRNSINAKLVPLPSHLIPPTSSIPLSEWDGNSLKNNLSNAIRIVPDRIATGFFISCLQRLS